MVVVNYLSVVYEKKDIDVLEKKKKMVDIKN